MTYVDEVYYWWVYHHETWYILEKITTELELRLNLALPIIYGDVTLTCLKLPSMILHVKVAKCVKGDWPDAFYMDSCNIYI